MWTKVDYSPVASSQMRTNSMHNIAKGSASEKQRAVIRRIHPEMTSQEMADMSSAQANDLISYHTDNWRGYDPSSRQEQVLRDHGLWRDGMKRGEAWDAILPVREIRTR